MTSRIESEHFDGDGPVWLRWVVMAAAVGWSVFQLSIASWLILDTVHIRSIHLAFALLLVFCTRPRFLAKSSKRVTSSPTWVVGLHVGLGVVAALLALTLTLDYEGIATRYGTPLLRDIVVGVALIVFLLEACRRGVGPALPVVAMLFTAYAFLGPWMPELLAFKGVSLRRYIGQMTMSTEGVYGVPLRVSATIVFLFVLFGAMLEKAGGGRFFTRLALSLLGSFRGGPAKAAVLSSGLTGAISGSSIANIVTTGTFTIPLMKKVGYPATKAAAIEVAASTDGQLAPPIMGAAAFIIAEYVNVPYLAVVKAAAIPAFASYATLLYITHIEACKLGLKGIPRAELPRFRAVLAEGAHFLIPLAVLIYFLMVKRRSPESAAFSAVIVMAVVMLAQRMVISWRRGEGPLRGVLVGLRDLVAALESGARNMVPVALATAGAGIIVGVVSLGLGGIITQAIHQVSSGSIFVMLLITAVASLIIGMGLPTTATYITMASLIAPVIVTIAAEQSFFVPLMAAHLFCFYFGILADDTPPVGLAAYAAAAIAKSPPIATGIQGFMYDIRTAILPFMFIFNPELILHGIDSWGHGLLIFGSACLGTCCFASATQGWFVRKNRAHHVILLLLAALLFLQPGVTAGWVGLAFGQRYLMWVAALAVMGATLFLQIRETRVRAPA